MSDDIFIGVWVLDPEQCIYQLGEPPQAGFYEIQAHGDGYRFIIDWLSADGDEQHTEFEGIPDGVEYPYGDPDIADATSFNRVDALTLASRAIKDGEVINHAIRMISKDGRTMTVSQAILTAEGRMENIAIYYRKK